jgi:profilin
MSWQDYVNAYLVNFSDQVKGTTAYGVCEHGAIIGNADGSVWAATSGFALKNETIQVEREDGTGNENVNVNEFEHLVDAFNNNGKTYKKGGVRINGEKYYSVNFDSETQILYLKKSGGGAAIAKSNLGFVIGTFNTTHKLKNFNGADEPQNPGITNRVVEELQKFLLANNL